MFKKTLAAAAVLGVFAGSAIAADVTLYGLVDYGFNYQHIDADIQGVDAESKFTMNSGMNSGSRFGLKGTEDLGNGLTIGFVLENGFSADDGQLDNGGRLFGREAQAYLAGDFGTISMGRVGQLASSNGTFGLLGRVSPFSAGWGDSLGTKFVTANGWGRFDNTVTYVTPEFSGLKVYAQYSFKNDSKADGDEGKADADRYYGLGATFDMAALQLVAVIDSVNYGHLDPTDANKDLDDSLTFTFGGNYDFGVAKVYAMGQYFDNAKAVGQKCATDDNSAISGGYSFATNGAEGYGLSMGVGVPALGGTVKGMVGYLDAEETTNSDNNVSRWTLAVGYDYSLSKRTSVYTGAAYTKDSVETGVASADRDPKTIEVMAGLIHKF